jgi:hypothetical protein
MYSFEGRNISTILRFFRVSLAWLLLSYVTLFTTVQCRVLGSGDPKYVLQGQQCTVHGFRYDRWIKGSWPHVWFRQPDDSNHLDSWTLNSENSAVNPHRWTRMRNTYNLNTSPFILNREPQTLSSKPWTLNLKSPLTRSRTLWIENY